MRFGANLSLSNFLQLKQALAFFAKPRSLHKTRERGRSERQPSIMPLQAVPAHESGCTGYTRVFASNPTPTPKSLGPLTCELWRVIWRGFASRWPSDRSPDGEDWVWELLWWFVGLFVKRSWRGRGRRGEVGIGRSRRLQGQAMNSNWGPALYARESFCMVEL